MVIIQGVGPCDLGSNPNTLTKDTGVSYNGIITLCFDRSNIGSIPITPTKITRNDPQREVTRLGRGVIAGSSPVYATKKMDVRSNG